MSAKRTASGRGRPIGRWALLVAPFLGLLPVAGYARAEPALLGLPFFYAYQLIWVALVVACLAGAALLDRAGHSDGWDDDGGDGVGAFGVRR